MGTREDGELQVARQDQRWFQLLLDVALIANEAESLDGALRSALARVCEYKGWYAAFGHVPERGRDIWWIEPGDERSDDEILSDGLRRSARRWAKQVMEAGETQSIDDFEADIRTEFAVPQTHPTTGGAIATPLLVGSKPMGAMVFFSRHPLSERLARGLLDDLHEVIESVGTQMGRVVERWQLSRHIAEEAEQERETLGRQIHDGIAQQLVGVKLLAQNLRKRIEKSTGERFEQWDVLIDSLVKAQTEARAVARGLSAGAILSSSESLVDQLDQLREVIETGHGIECTLVFQEGISLSDRLTSAHLFRIAREAIMNALRHGAPGRIDIEIMSEGDDLVLEVRDDGSGLSASADTTAGMGVLGMRYRAQALGGRLEIESRPGEGTVVRCIV